MRSIGLTVLSMSAACLLQTGCATDAPRALTEPSFAMNASRAETSIKRPFKGSCDVIAIFETATLLRITGGCQLTHLGVAMITIDQTITPGPDGIPFVNQATYTAANGDKLYSTTIGTATPNSSGLRLDGIETFAGGTGRFSTASGESVVGGQVVFTGPATASATFHNEGVLIY